MDHCIARIVDIVAQGRDDRRAVLQLGYNLGRLSELTGLGREFFWDRWKGPVDSWNLPALRVLVRELRQFLAISPIPPAFSTAIDKSTIDPSGPPSA